MRKRVVEVCVSSDMRGVQWWRARLSSCEGKGVVANEDTAWTGCTADCRTQLLASYSGTLHVFRLCRARILVKLDATEDEACLSRAVSTSYLSRVTSELPFWPTSPFNHSSSSLPYLILFAYRQPPGSHLLGPSWSRSPLRARPSCTCPSASRCGLIYGR